MYDKYLKRVIDIILSFPGNGAISHLCFLHKPLYYAQTCPCRGKQPKSTSRAVQPLCYNRTVGRFWANVGIFIIPYPPAMPHKNKRIFPTFIPSFYLLFQRSMLPRKKHIFLAVFDAAPLDKNSKLKSHNSLIINCLYYRYFLRT